MNEVKLPVSDNGALSFAGSQIPNNSPIFNRESNELFMKYNDNLIPVGSNVAYTKGIDAFYFRGIYDNIVDWPNFGFTSVIYLKKDSEFTNGEIKHQGFWVNISRDNDNPNWQPFCKDNESNFKKYFEVGTIFMYAGEFIPQGYLECNGQELPIKGNYELYSVVGKQYCTDPNQNIATFRLPKISDDYIKYIIKSEVSTVDKNIGTMYLYAGNDVPRGYIDLRDGKFSSLECFELFLLLQDSFGKLIDDDFGQLPFITNAYTKVLIKSKNNLSELPAGIVAMTPNGFIQDGFIQCDNSLIPKINYKELYKALGENYGSSAISFGIPNIDSEYIDFSIKTGKVENNILGVK